MKKTFLLVLLMSFGLTAINVSAKVAKESRMDRSRLNIGAYILQPYAHTEQHVKEIAACGIDFMTCVPNDKNLLDLFQKHNIGAVVSGVLPGWWGGDGKNAGSLSKKNPMEAYEAAADNVTSDDIITRILDFIPVP